MTFDYIIENEVKNPDWSVGRGFAIFTLVTCAGIRERLIEKKHSVLYEQRRRNRTSFNYRTISTQRSGTLQHITSQFDIDAAQPVSQHTARFLIGQRLTSSY